LIGSRLDVEKAFGDAGWTTSTKLGLRSGLRTFFAVVEQHPYNQGPVSKLLLHHRKPDLVFQKQNDTFAKRHHIRLWQETASFNGKPVWIGAATHDVAIAFSPASGFRHLVDPSIDLERQRLIDDLMYSQSATFLGMGDRANVAKESKNATGDPLQTDGRIAILSLNSSPLPSQLNRSGRLSH
jgi:hypothetical protein